MHNQSRDELEQIAKMRRIKNYKETSKEGLIKKIKKILNNSSFKIKTQLS